MKHYALSVRTLICTAIVLVSGCVSEKYKTKIAEEFRQNRISSYQSLTTAEPNAARDARMPQVLNGEMTVEQCLAVAMQNNKEILAQQTNLDKARGQIVEATATAMPKISVGTFAKAHKDENPSNPRQSYEWSAKLRQPLYQGGESEAAMDAAATYEYQVRQELRKTVQKVRLDVLGKYLSAVLAGELVNVSKQAKIDATENLRLFRTKFEQGESLKYEVLRAQVRLQAIEAELIQRQNDYRIAVAGLLNAMGVSQLSDVNLSDPLAYQKIDVDARQCLALAMTSRPELLVGESNVRLANADVLSKKSESRPKAYLDAAYQEDYPGSNYFFNGQKQNDYSSSLGIVVEWSVFDGGRTSGRVAQARANLRKQKINLRKMEEQVQYEITQALLNLKSSDEFVISQQGNVDNAAEALRLAQVNFRQGTNTSLDVISAELDLAQARADYVRSVHNYMLSKYNLSAATGIIGESELPVIADDSQIKDTAEISQ